MRNKYVKTSKTGCPPSLSRLGGVSPELAYKFLIHTHFFLKFFNFL